MSPMLAWHKNTGPVTSTTVRQNLQEIQQVQHLGLYVIHLCLWNWHENEQEASSGARAPGFLHARSASRRPQLRTQIAPSSECQQLKLRGGDEEHGFGRHTHWVLVPAQTLFACMTSLHVTACAKWALSTPPCRWYGMN